MVTHVRDKVMRKPTISVSVPPHQREAFYQALVRLKEEDGTVFMSASALIVRAVIRSAAALDARHSEDVGDAASDPRASTVGGGD